jgi:ParB/RepB/Spo0J family partition protein
MGYPRIDEGFEDTRLLDDFDGGVNDEILDDDVENEDNELNFESEDFPENEDGVTIDEETSELLRKLDVYNEKEEEKAKQAAPSRITEAKNGKTIIKRLGYVPIDKVVPNTEQPRDNLFESEKEKQEMIQSIRENGIIHPAIVIPIVNGFMLKDGERRWTCAKEAGLKKFFTIVEYYISIEGKKSCADKIELLEDAFMANLHQLKMSPLEEARAYIKWLQMTGRSRSELAKKVGKTNSEIGQILKLLNLSQDMQKEVADRSITKVLAQNLPSYPNEHHQLLREEYEKELKRHGGVIPSSNPYGWVARTLRCIAERKGISPLKPKKGKIKPYFDMLINFVDRCIIQTDNTLTELKGLSNPTISMNRIKMLEVLSRMDRLMERAEMVSGEIRDRMRQ